jgi:prolyl-tRNA synthetase
MEKIELNLDKDLLDNVINLIEDLNENLIDSAWRSLEKRVVTTENLEEIPELINNQKVVSFNWCGDSQCGQSIEEEYGFDILGIQSEIEDETNCVHCNKKAKYRSLIAKTY